MSIEKMGDFTLPEEKPKTPNNENNETKTEKPKEFSLPWGQVAIKSPSSIEILSMQNSEEEPRTITTLGRDTVIKAENLVFCAELRFQTLTENGETKEIIMHCPGPFALRNMVKKYFSFHEKERIIGSVRCGYNGENRRDYPEIDDYKNVIKEVFTDLGFTGLYYINDRLKQ